MCRIPWFDKAFQLRDHRGPVLPVADADQHYRGVAGIDRDLVNVSRVMALSPLVHVRKIVIPPPYP